MEHHESPSHPARSALALALFAALLLGAVACASKAMILEAKYPTEPTSLEPDTKLTVRIGEVTDAREFESEPDKLSVPALWDEQMAKLSQAQVIGAHAGDGTNIANIYLTDGQNVKGIVHDLLAVALRQAGYTVVDDEDADFTATARVDQFWVWMTPDAMTIRVEAIVQAHVSIAGPAGTEEMDVSGYNDSRDVSKSPESYRFALNEGLYDFFTILASRLIQLEMPSAPAPK